MELFEISILTTDYYKICYWNNPQTLIFTAVSLDIIERFTT